MLHAPTSRVRDDDDLTLVLRAVGASARPDELAERWTEGGGLLGLWHGGGAGLFGSDAALVARLDAFLELGRRLVRAPPWPEVVDGPEAVLRYTGPRLALEAQEGFWVLCLDARGRPLALSRVSQGTLTACLVHPREVFAPALRCRAHSVVLLHNHPSGDPEPSVEDVALTARLVDAGQILGIPVVDHVVVARTGFRSLGGAPPGASEEPPCLAMSGQP
ncbi:MAG: JAB domain-containing protein [Myxococcales bacterium]|nr:JAB domain-containing protein [Myxococcales bacterium]MCB9649084.1 JAB domain-containing protein [Deltaproteobacteria bacterium]